MCSNKVNKHAKYVDSFGSLYDLLVLGICLSNFVTQFPIHQQEHSIVLKPFLIVQSMKTMKAIKTIAKHRAEIQVVSVPAMRDDYVLVKVNAVALNPTDW